jgi:hyperosmotically inducible protein
MAKNILSETLALGLVLSMSPAVIGSVTGADLSIGSQTPTDKTLKERVAFRLETSAIVRMYHVTVKVDGGVATLSGTVATAAQKAAAAQIAKVDGITRVENTMDVDAGVDQTLSERLKGGFSKTGEKIGDGWITTRLNWFFGGEDLLEDSNIVVHTKDHVVTLKGTVPSQSGRERAVELAQATEGVKTVVNQLTINTSAP